MEPVVTEHHLQIARQMQSSLKQAWKGDEPSMTLIECGGLLASGAHGPYAPIQLTPSPSEQGVVLYAKDSWNLIRAAFLIDYKQGRTRICRNPECPAPYFLAKRKTQKYCERGDCTAYAQRQYALGWWNRDGRKRRAKFQHRKWKSEKRASTGQMEGRQGENSNEGRT